MTLNDSGRRGKRAAPRSVAVVFTAFMLFSVQVVSNDILACADFAGNLSFSYLATACEESSMTSGGLCPRLAKLALCLKVGPSTRCGFVCLRASPGTNWHARVGFEEPPWATELLAQLSRVQKSVACACALMIQQREFPGTLLLWPEAPILLQRIHRVAAG